MTKKVCLILAVLISVLTAKAQVDAKAQVYAKAQGDQNAQVDAKAQVDVKPVVVKGKINASRLLQSAAKNFSSKYGKNIVCQALQYRAIEQNNHYEQLSLNRTLVGMFDFNQNTRPLYFDNKANTLYCAPLSSMKSYAFDQGQRMPYVDENRDYGGTMPGNTRIFLLKRAIEVYGPLNPATVKFYSAKVDKIETNSLGEQIAVISFATLKNLFPKHIRLMCDGELTYNLSTKCVQNVVINDMVDYYTNYIHHKTYDGKKSTSIQFKIQYKSLGKGKIVPHSVQSVIVHNGEGGYQIAHSPRPRKANVMVRDSEYVLFSGQINVSKSVTDTTKQYMVGDNVGDSFYAYAPFDAQMLDLLSKIPIANKKRLIKELSNDGLSLEKQAQNAAFENYFINYKTGKSPLDFMFSQQKQDYIINQYYKSARQLYEKFYNKQYN